MDISLSGQVRIVLAKSFSCTALLFNAQTCVSVYGPQCPLASLLPKIDLTGLGGSSPPQLTLDQVLNLLHTYKYKSC